MVESLHAFITKELKKPVEEEEEEDEDNEDGEKHTSINPNNDINVMNATATMKILCEFKI